MRNEPIAWRERHKKVVEVGRCCWVCGKLGGQGFTTALRLAGYRMEPGQMGYAHIKCMSKAQNEAFEREQKERNEVIHKRKANNG